MNRSMKQIIFALCFLIVAIFLGLTPLRNYFGTAEANDLDGNWKEAKSIYEFTVNDINGQPVSLEKYKGQVLIIVNVASKCGYTNNHYTELNELYDEYAESKGLKILAFPCNQFGGQEPGDRNIISEFTKKRKVKFDIFEKINVNGNDAHPLFKYLKHKQGGLLLDAIKWNFTKFIIDRNGQPVDRQAHNTSLSIITTKKYIHIEGFNTSPLYILKIGEDRE